MLCKSPKSNIFWQQNFYIKKLIQNVNIRNSTSAQFIPLKKQYDSNSFLSTIFFSEKDTTCGVVKCANKMAINALPVRTEGIINPSEGCCFEKIAVNEFQLTNSDLNDIFSQLDASLLQKNIENTDFYEALTNIFSLLSDKLLRASNASHDPCEEYSAEKVLLLLDCLSSNRPIKRNKEHFRHCCSILQEAAEQVKLRKYNCYSGSNAKCALIFTSIFTTLDETVGFVINALLRKHPCRHIVLVPSLQSPITAALLLQLFREINEIILLPFTFSVIHITDYQYQASSDTSVHKSAVKKILSHPRVVCVLGESDHFCALSRTSALKGLYKQGAVITPPAQFKTQRGFSLDLVKKERTAQLDSEYFSEGSRPLFFFLQPSPSGTVDSSVESIFISGAFGLSSGQNSNSVHIAYVPVNRLSLVNEKLAKILIPWPRNELKAKNSCSSFITEWQVGHVFDYSVDQGPFVPPNGAFKSVKSFGETYGDLCDLTDDLNSRIVDGNRISLDWYKIYSEKQGTTSSLPSTAEILMGAFPMSLPKGAFAVPTVIIVKEPFLLSEKKSIPISSLYLLPPAHPALLLPISAPVLFIIPYYPDQFSEKLILEWHSNWITQCWSRDESNQQCLPPRNIGLMNFKYEWRAEQNCILLQ